MADPFSTFLNTTSGHVSFSPVDHPDTNLTPSELPGEAWRVLEALDGAGPLEVNTLRATTKLTTMRLTTALSMLAEHGLVRLTSDDNDDLAVITDDGRQTLSEGEGPKS